MNDEYEWLRDKNWPQVKDDAILKHLTKENNYFEKMMQPVKNLEQEIYQELAARIKQEDQSYPVKIDNYQYYLEMKENKDYPIFLRKSSSGTEILLDCNELSLGKSSFSMGDTEVSEDHNKYAYAYDEDGSERYTINLLDLANKTTLADKIKDTIGNIIWNKNSDGFYYLKLNEEWRPDRVYFHQLGTTETEDILIFEETNPGFFIDITKSSSKEYLLIQTGDSSSNETWYISLTYNKLEVAIKRQKDLLYSINHINDKFYILTNDMGKNFRLVSSEGNFSNLKEIIAHNDDEYLTDFDLYNDYVVITKRVLGLNKIQYYKEDIFDGEIEFDEEVYQVDTSFTHKDDPYLRINYSSLTKPNSILEYDFASKVLYTRKVTEIPSGYIAEDYIAKRLWITSGDSTKVPISMVYRKDLKEGPNNLLLYGYGSYGAGIPVNFNANIISLLDRGFVYVIAHIRGGDDLGFKWYEDAKFLNKKRTFEDFIAVAEYLIEQKYTSNKQLAIMGGSAGGMLMGAVINQRPDLFNTVVALVPFVDVLNTMLDESLPLTPIEFNEWGNPKLKEYYDYIKSYSPYDNVKKQEYPNILVTAGLTDPRVGYWEAAKWVAKLRKLKQDDNLLLLKTEMDSGHMGQQGRFKRLEERAMIYSFIIMNR